jgi:hypothetical protein
MATQSVKPSELEWGQFIIVQLTHYKVLGVYKKRGGGWNVRTEDRARILTTFTFEEDERVMAVVGPRETLGGRRTVRVRSKNNRRY